MAAPADRSRGIPHTCPCLWVQSRDKPCPQGRLWSDSRIRISPTSPCHQVFPCAPPLGIVPRMGMGAWGATGWAGLCAMVSPVPDWQRWAMQWRVVRCLCVLMWAGGWVCLGSIEPFAPPPPPGGAGGLRSAIFRNFPQSPAVAFLPVPLACVLVPCVSPVQRCGSLRLRGVWSDHRKFSGISRNFRNWM